MYIGTIININIRFLPLLAHLRPLTLYMIYFFPYPRTFDVLKYTKLTTFFTFFVPPFPEKNFQLRHGMIIFSLKFQQ